MVNPKRFVACAALAGAILSGGCSSPSAGQKMVDAVTQTIDLGTSVPVWGAAGAATGDLAVVWGGATGWSENPTATGTGWIVSAKSPVSAFPTAAAPMAARSGHIAVSYSGRLIFWGGIDAQGHHLKDGAILDPQSNTWQKMPDAPFGLASPKAIVDGDYVLFGAGRREGNNFNPSILEYHMPSRSWKEIQTSITRMVTWAIVDQTITTVSRQPNGADLTVNWFGRDGRPIGQATTLDTGLPRAAYIGITAHEQHAVVAVSTREKTEVFRVAANSSISRHDELDGMTFSPAMSTASGTSADDTRRDGDVWLSFMEWEIQAIAIDDLSPRGAWRLPTCRTESTWIALGDRKFLRYGGFGCGGDVPADHGAPMQLVDLSYQK